MAVRSMFGVLLGAAFAGLVPVVAPASSLAASANSLAAPRIVSLMPSLTEDLFALGAGPQVVAVSQFTDFPAAARSLPTVASFASLDAERIVRLHPDLVVGIPAQAALVADLRRVGLRVELLPDDSFADIFADLARLGALSGHPREAARLSAALRARTAALVRSVSGVPPGTDVPGVPARADMAGTGASGIGAGADVRGRAGRTTRPSVLVVLGVTPIFTVGDRSYIAHLIELAGGRNAAGVDEAYVRYSAEAIVAAQPDFIVTDRSAGLTAALGAPPWNALRAVREKHVYVLGDADILERPGPRYNEGLAWLIARLHPAPEHSHVAR
jgi:iron complex transport system substrate-binding protein